MRSNGEIISRILEGFFNVDPLAEKYLYNSPYAFSENHVTAHIELEGLEKVKFMVARFEPNKREYRSPNQAAKNPSKKENTNFENVNRFGAKTELGFRVDLKTGEYSVIDAHDRDKNFIKKAIDAFKGDVYKSDHKLSVTADENGFSINGLINGAEFSISGSVSDGNIEMVSELRNVPNEDGAIINIGDGDSITPSLSIGTKQGDNCFICGKGNSDKQKSTISFNIDSESNAKLKKNRTTDERGKQKTVRP
jgi:hypothetical protein